MTTYGHDFSDKVDGSGYVLNLDLTLTTDQARDKLKNAMPMFSQQTIRVCLITFAYYIPSYDILVSNLMEIRFETGGSVRPSSFEVLPVQIYTADGVTDPDVQSRDALVLFFSIIRLMCCFYTCLLIIIKLLYRIVVGNKITFKSVLLDLFQIFLGTYPVIHGMLI